VALVVLGAGGHAAEICTYVADLRDAGAPVRLIGCLDDHKPAGRSGTVEVLGGLDALESVIRGAGAGLRCITAVGDNATRRRMVERTERLVGGAIEWYTLRHPSAIVGADVVIGPGTCLAPQSVVTTRVRVGAHGILNVNVSVSHDTVIGDFVNINPGAVIAGYARVSEGCFIGAGATLIDRVTVGEWSIVGAGAAVVDDLPGRVTAVGVPARVIKRHDRDS
jgi:sugar O-acyltransferase (sialic acid O-acetyltransferase NeuD family)